MAKGRSGPATKREVDKYAERTVNRVQNKYTQMRREIYHGSLMRSQLVAENRHDEAKQVQRAVRKYTNSWGRHYGVLLAVENRNRDFDRPKQQLEMEKKDFQEATKTHRTYVGDPFYRKLLSEYTNDLLQDHKSNIDIEKERRQSVNKMMARLNLKGHRKEAKQLQQAHKQYSKVFGENYSLLKAVHMREEHPSQYWHRKGPKKGAERPRAKKPIDKPFPPLTTPKENLAHVPVKAEKGLGYTPSLYSGYEPPPPSGP
ncbi:hypothetical protein MMC10_004777 [Thelotrema lepadinum]|nr:hypothetical protein [Thelotrema lepadinum]